jgi:uncharacterized protein (DUF58 family)
VRSLRLTGRGSLFLAATFAIAIAAAASESNHLVLLSALLAGVFVATAALTLLGSRKLELSRTLPDAVHAHDTFEFTVSVRNPKRLTPAFALSIEERLTLDGRAAASQKGPVRLVVAPPGEAREAGSEATAFRRGQARFEPAAITTSFPPGLVTCRVEVAAPGEILIYPRQGTMERRVLDPHLSRVEHPDLFPTATSAGDDEFAGLREYRPGDNPRRIHWKMLARSPEKLFVREYEDARAREAVILLETLVPAGARDARRASRLERAISFSAALAEVLLASNYSVRFVAFGPGLVDLALTPRRGALAELNEALALLEAPQDRGLPELVDALGRTRDEVFFVLTIGQDAAAPAALALPPRRTVVIPAEAMRSMMYYAA